MEAAIREQSAFQMVRFQVINQAPKMKRIILKADNCYVIIKVSDIVYFTNNERKAYVYINDGKVYKTSKNLNKWEEILDRDIFFRANRELIVNGWYIKNYKTYQRKKIEFEISTGLEVKSFLISETKTNIFRNWLSKL